LNLPIGSSFIYDGRWFDNSGPECNKIIWYNLVQQYHVNFISLTSGIIRMNISVDNKIKRVCRWEHFISMLVHLNQGMKFVEVINLWWCFIRTIKLSNGEWAHPQFVGLQLMDKRHMSWTGTSMSPDLPQRTSTKWRILQLDNNICLHWDLIVLASNLLASMLTNRLRVGCTRAKSRYYEPG